LARRTEVFGPAYLDRVLLVDRPLAEIGPPLDQSVDGRWEFGEGLTLVDPEGREIALELPDDWPGPTGEVQLARPLAIGPPGIRRTVRGLSWHDDLGGMGAGYAAAFGGELISALGPEDDPTSRAVTDRLAHAGIRHRPIRVPDHPADWTLLVTSGACGDKLPIGFRGCHAAIGSILPDSYRPCDLRVVAALPNRLAADALRASGATVRFFAPALRNMVDHDCPVSGFARAIDVLCCNRHEWERLADREEVARRVSVLAVTDGPLGSTVRFTTPAGEAGSLRLGAFPRSDPPRDTNRAGEAYAAALLTVLLDRGWTPGVTDESLARLAAESASIAAALVLDRLDFGFPTPAEIVAARRAGRVEGPAGGTGDDLR
jgi:pfkB family carbohydrate kinase